MSNKEKKIVPTNLLALREKLGYTQEQLAEILDVSTRMVCNYETNVSNLPPDKALILSKRFNYSLDWIYCNSDDNIDRNKFKNYSEEDCINFLVDIRDFITCSDDKITLSINDSYWDYIKNVNTIRHSKKALHEKEREIAQLNGKYKFSNNSNLSWEFSTDINDFISMIKIVQDSSCIYASDNTDHSRTISKEQIEEAIDFLNLLTNTIKE